MSDQKHPNFSYTDFGDMHELGNKQRPRPEEQKVPHTTKHDLEALKATKERLQKEVLQTGRGRRGRHGRRA